MAINDFRRQQYVFIDNDVILSDLDDLSFEEEVVENDGDDVRDDIDIKNDKKKNYSAGEKSFNETSAERHSNIKVARDMDEKKKKTTKTTTATELDNMRKAHKHFISPLLPYSTPPLLLPLVIDILDSFSQQTNTSATPSYPLANSLNRPQNISYSIPYRTSSVTSHCLHLMNTLLQAFVTGQYIKRTAEDQTSTNRNFEIFKK